MDLDQLKAFVLVSEKGNLSRAAKGLGLKSSQLSSLHRELIATILDAARKQRNPRN
jgi:DNA-binding transcriptional LysR family regulator